MEQPDAARRLPARRLPAQRAPGRGAGRASCTDAGLSWTRCWTWRSPRTRSSSGSPAAASAATTAAHVFHVEYNQPKPRASATSAAASCTSATTTREETVRKRLEVYHTRDRADHRLLQGPGPGGHDPRAGQGRRGHRARDGGPASPEDASSRAACIRPRCPPGTAAVRVRVAVVTAAGQQRRSRFREGASRMVEIKTPSRSRRCARRGWSSPPSTRRPREAAVPGATTKDLDDVARKVLADHGAKPNFLGYGGFPATICTSVNDVVVHGIPGDRDRAQGRRPHLHRLRRDHRRLARRRGVHRLRRRRATRRSCVELSRVTEESMWAGIAAITQGQPAGRHLQGDRGLHPPPAAPGRRQVRDHRGLRRPRHRLRDAHGPAPAELRRPQARPRARSWSPGFCLAIEPMVTLGTRHDPMCSPTTGRSSHERRHLVLALGALGRADRGGPAGADRAGRRQGEAGRARRHGGARPAGIGRLTRALA